MNNNLAPKYKYSFGEFWVLWYEVSNSYSVIDEEFRILLDCYLKSKTEKEFITNIIAIDNKILNAKTLALTITNYLKGCNKFSTPLKIPSKVLDSSNREILKQYVVNGKAFQIYFDSELVLKTVHPAIAHLSNNLISNIRTTFDIYLKKDYLHLFKDGQLITRVPKRDYHMLQGKFLMQLFNTIYENEESDWVGTFHGSSITDGNLSILFVGESGKGKSTLCAILANSGFYLLADDVSPMLSKNKNIYHNPSAISIKQGAFNALQSIVINLNDLPVVEFNKTKGPIKYIPCSVPLKDNYPCKCIVIVNYKKGAKTTLEKVSIKELLETIIPDSWLSPDPIHAQQFLNWIKTLKIYKLTYSNAESVTKEVSNLFKQLNENI